MMLLPRPDFKSQICFAVIIIIFFFFKGAVVMTLSLMMEILRHQYSAMTSANEVGIGILPSPEATRD